MLAASSGRAGTRRVRAAAGSRARPATTAYVVTRRPTDETGTPRSSCIGTRAPAVNSSAVANVNVTSSNTGSPTVTVASVPANLVVGATLLGRTVTNIAGTTITLDGNANLRPALGR